MGWAVMVGKGMVWHFRAGIEVEILYVEVRAKRLQRKARHDAFAKSN